MEGSWGLRAMLNSEPSAAMKEYFPANFAVEGKAKLNCVRIWRKASGRSFARCWMKAEAVGTSCGWKEKNFSSSYN